MADKRKRGQNFTLEEKDRLVKLLLEHKDTILNKRTDGATNESKALAWISVTNTFNSSGTVYRNKDSLMKIWEKLKSESKIYYSASRRDTSQTGGGPSVIKIDPILDQVCTILGRGCTGIKGVPDSDNLLNETELLEEFTVEPLPKVICVTELDGKDNLPSEISPNTPSSSKVEVSEEHNVRKTPLWSRRRPQLAQSNERVEAVSNLCDSFKEINKKKKLLKI